MSIMLPREKLRDGTPAAITPPCCAYSRGGVGNLRFSLPR